MATRQEALRAAAAGLEASEVPVDVHAVLRELAFAGSTLAQRMVSCKCGDCGNDIDAWDMYGSCYRCGEAGA